MSKDKNLAPKFDAEDTELVFQFDLALAFTAPIPPKKLCIC